jgi:hypothetical protein
MPFDDKNQHNDGRLGRSVDNDRGRVFRTQMHSDRKLQRTLGTFEHEDQNYAPSSGHKGHTYQYSHGIA